MSLELVFIITAVCFTFVGWIFGVNYNDKKAIAATIDALIDQGYLKTEKDNNGNVKILKVRD